MKKHFKKYFIPHKHNDYRPHFFQEATLTFIAAVALISFLGSGLHVTLLRQSADFLAAVVPNVIVDLTNDDRTDNGLGALTINSTLVEAAQLKANHMAENEYFAHNSPDGLTPWHWFIEAGYGFSAAGENLAVNFTDSVAVEAAWMDSPGHRANILNGEFTEIGIATAEGRFEGRDTVYVVQLFGRPSVPVPPPTPPIAPAQTPEEETPAPAPAPIPTPEPTPAPPAVAEATTEEETIPEPAEEIDETAAEPEVLADPSLEELEVIAEDDLFIAVVDPNAEEAAAVQAEATFDTLTLEKQSTLLERLASTPQGIFSVVYTVLAALVIFAIVMRLVIEFEMHHTKHIVYALLVLVLLLALFYIGGTYFFSGLLIV